MLRKIDKDLWVAEQPLRYLGLSIGSRMTVIQLANHDLVIISPIQVNNTMVSQLDEIGTVRHIIAPNLYHYLFAANFKMLYPNATFWAVPGLETKKQIWRSTKLSHLMRTIYGMDWNPYF